MDPQRFRELALEEIDAVWRMAMHLSRDPHEANDLVQETYLKALAAERRFELRAQGVRPWLLKILHNTFYTRVGRAKRQKAFGDRDPQGPASAAPDQPGVAWDLEHLDWEHVDDRLKHAIEQLPEHYRTVLLLWAVEGLKYREIADVLDVALGTVMSRLHRARATLHEQLADFAKEQRMPGPTPES
jgi:RNA polymerase sigma-70 factor (ECF subfamily)